MSAHAQAPSRPIPFLTFLNHIVPTVLMGLIMTVCYLAGFHQPEPHKVPVAVVGSSASATQLAHTLDGRLGDHVDIQVMPSRDVAEMALRHLDIAGAYVPGQGKSELLVASARSETTTSTVVKIFSAVSEKTKSPMHVTDVVPLGEHDSAGQNGFFFLVVLSVSAYALGIAVSVAGASYSFGRRTILAVVGAIILATVEFGIARGFMHMFETHPWAIWAVAMAYAATVMLLVVGLHAFTGRWSAAAFSALFVAINFTTSGGVFEPFMQPGFFAWFNHFWIGSGFIDVVRSLSYFPDVDSSHGFGILAAWACLAVILLLVGRTREKQQQIAHRVAHLKGLTAEQEEELEEDVAV